MNATVDTPATPATSDRLRQWGPFGFFALLAGLLYLPIVRDMATQWADDPNYSHGFLVPGFSAFLVWERRAELARLPIAGSWGGAALLLLGVVALILGHVGAENFLTRSSLIAVLAGGVLLHLGPQWLQKNLFPLAYLVFMIPLPAIVFNSVAFPLQSLAARNATWTLDGFGVPVLRDGNVIVLSHITLGVTEACSGIRSLISLVALAVAWAHLSFRHLAASSILVLAAIPITIAANAGRIVATGLIGQWFGVEYAQGFFHAFAGWAIFIFAFAGLLAVHGLIRLVAPSTAKEGAP